MKHLTLIALLFSISAVAQTGTLSIDTASTMRGIKTFPYAIDSNPIKLSEPNYTFTAKHPFPIMRISNLKPDTSYHVWIDKRAIKWTSDSTFILKRKN